MIWFVSAVLFLICFIWLRDTEKGITDLHHRLDYERELPLIKEYADLKGYRRYSRDGHKVDFGVLWRDDGETLWITDVERKLKDFKADLERNCPKKCTKKKARG